MKRCPTCSIENADAMQFCLQCGASLANAPFVVNFQGGGQQQQQPQQPLPNQQPNTPFGGQPFQNQFQNQFSNVPPSRPKSNSKIFLAIGGVLALFLLLFAAGAAIFIYNFALKDEVATNNNPTPTVSPTPTGDKSPSPSSSPTSSPRISPTAPPFNSGTTNSSTTNSTDPNGARVTFEKQWVDYNVTEKGRSGMRIHTTFTVYKIKDVDSYLAIYFSKKDGTKLSTSNRDYRSKDGQVAVYRSLKPNYDETYYKDLTVFIPYDEFNLTRGKYDLRMDSDVIYENGDMVGHLNDYDFEYEKY